MKKILAILVALSLIMALLMPFTPVRAKEGNDTSLSSVDSEGINNEFVPSTAPWDWEMVDVPYQVKVKEAFTSGQILQFQRQGSSINLQPMALEWTNDLDMIQQVSMPQDVNPMVTNPNNQGTITWEDAYGSGMDFAWECTPSRLNKTLSIAGLSDLPPPQQYILDNGNPALRLNLIFAPSSDVDIYVDEELWDKNSKKQTFNEIEFRKEGEVLWSFAPLMYWDSEENEGQSVATLRKSGNKLYISIRVPYEWLQTASYPVFIDADVTIEAATSNSFNVTANRGGTFWTSPTVGYVIYVDNLQDMVYQKTTDGGATWDGKVNIRTGKIDNYDCWADWQTPGDAGTKIHIAYMDNDTDDSRYIYLETASDTVAGDDQIEACQGTGTFFAGPNRVAFHISVAKTRGGNIVVALRYTDSVFTRFESFYTSPDAAAWTSKASSWEGDWDFILLFPGNAADNQDAWATFWDISANEISLKTFDNSGNSWSEQLISGSMVEAGDYLQMDGQILLDTRELVFSAWSQFDNAASDLKVWVINGAGSITAKTNVITDQAETVLVSVFINQINGDIYIAYVQGTAWQSLVKCVYKRSPDVGGTWGGQSTMQADAEDDMRWVSAGAMKAAWGGKFQPIWFDMDDFDLFTSFDNGISIVDPPSVTTLSTTGIAMDRDGVTSGLFSGNLTSLGTTANVSHWFEYGLTTGYGSFSANTTSNVTEVKTAPVPNNLTPGATYHNRFVAQNTVGTANGTDTSFTFTMPTTNILGATEVSFDGPTDAILNGNISSMGVATDVYVWFEWGYDTAYSEGTTPTQVLAGAGGVQAPIAGFDPNQEVFYSMGMRVGAVTSYTGPSSFAITTQGIVGVYRLAQVLSYVFVGIVALSVFAIVTSGGGLFVGIITAGIAMVVGLAGTGLILQSLEAIWRAPIP